MSNWAPGGRNFIRLKMAWVQVGATRNMYSEQGFDALMRAVFFEVCQRLMVESYCMPGSPHCQVASAMWCMMSRARYSLTGAPFLTARVKKVSLLATAFMNSSVTRTELLAFWKKM